jgi:hypothetical protein
MRYRANMILAWLGAVLLCVLMATRAGSTALPPGRSPRAAGDLAPAAPAGAPSIGLRDNVVAVRTLAQPDRPTACTTLPPMEVSEDQEGYVLYARDYRAANCDWCVPVSTVRYPIDLGAQDPTLFGETFLQIEFAEEVYAGPVKDPTWTVLWNESSEKTTDEGEKDPAFDPEVGEITGLLPTGAGSPIWTTVTMTLDAESVIDGENNIWLKQHDVGSDSNCTTCASTCIRVGRTTLRAAVDMLVVAVSPEADARQVYAADHNSGSLRITFSKPYSETTTNELTVQLSYRNFLGHTMYVEGDVRRLSATELRFDPREDLLDGVKYTAHVWGQEDAEADGRDHWVMSEAGDPLAQGKEWVFWTMPRVIVSVVPVQVIEGQTLIVGKDTALKTFVRWVAPPDVSLADVAPDVEVDDIKLSWEALQGQSGHKSWKKDYGWTPSHAPPYTARRREYRSFVTQDTSYDKGEKLWLQDSVNYWNFVPEDEGGYEFTAEVEIRDNLGKVRTFTGIENAIARTMPNFHMDVTAVAVGKLYTATGTIDLSTQIARDWAGLEHLYPIPWAPRPIAPDAVPWYRPSTTLWVWDWSSEGGVTEFFGRPQRYVMEELAVICARTTDCDVLAGYARINWIGAIGLSDPASSIQGILVSLDNVETDYRLIAAHETGHAITRPSFDDITAAEQIGEGLEVATHVDKRGSLAAWPPTGQRIISQYHTFMYYLPVESPPSEMLWISPDQYRALFDPISHPPAAATANLHAADQTLIAAGAIGATPAETKMMPWYLFDPGAARTPIAGPYKIVFLNAAAQEIAGYTRTFSATVPHPGYAPGLTTTIPVTTTDPLFFMVAVPYPATTAKVQIRKVSGGSETIMAEVVPAANPPTVTINAPPATWTGRQTINWTGNVGAAGAYAFDVSTDNGVTWRGLAVNLTATSYPLETTSLPNSSAVKIRVAATNGLRTTTAVAGPFTIRNAPRATYSTPGNGATRVGIYTPIVIGFSDAMNPTTLNASTVTVKRGGAAIPGDITYDATKRELTFRPKTSLVANQSYVTAITTGARSASGEALAAAKSWTWTTEEDISAPRVVAFSPARGGIGAPRNARIIAAWDKPLKAATMNATRFVVKTEAGTAVAGAVSYDSSTRTAIFTPAAGLAARTTYSVTLKAGIEDTLGNATVGDYRWSFTTGTADAPALTLTGAYADYGVDENNDGLYERLIVKVGVQAAAAGTYGLQARLAADGDDGREELTHAEANVTLPAGASFVALSFPGSAIGGAGLDGPYHVTNLLFSKMAGGLPVDLAHAVTRGDAYETAGYAASQFAAPLTLAGLPDLLVLSGATQFPTFNVRNYARHVTQPSSALTYRVVANTGRGAGVLLDTAGDITLNPAPGWEGKGAVTIQASYGPDSAQATFYVQIGWPRRIYLPLLLRNSSGGSQPTVRDPWRYAIKDDFERDFTWLTWSTGSWPPGGPGGWYGWARRNCAAFSGAYSAWAIGGMQHGSLLSCGANYPKALTAGMWHGPVSLKYTSAAEFRVKAMTNLSPGDELCALATTETPYALAHWYGVCRSGQTNGWEDMVLDLANVPGLGDLRGQPSVSVALRLTTTTATTRPFGAYVDDAVVRLCPQGLVCP